VEAGIKENELMEDDAKSDSMEGDCQSSEPSSAQHSKKKREKSLGQLCMQFINLLVGKGQDLSLEQAASMLSPNMIPEFHKIKTKVRNHPYI
jgi:hypothetical protein